jgi:hypothetical protein
VRCPGEIKEIKRLNCATHIKRRFVCRLCGLRWTSVERDLPNSIDATNASQAIDRLTSWQAKQADSGPDPRSDTVSAAGSSPQVYPTQRTLFESLDS